MKTIVYVVTPHNQSIRPLFYYELGFAVSHTAYSWDSGRAWTFKYEKIATELDWKETHSESSTTSSHMAILIHFSLDSTTRIFYSCHRHVWMNFVCHRKISTLFWHHKIAVIFLKWFLIFHLNFPLIFLCMLYTFPWLSYKKLSLVEKTVKFQHSKKKKTWKSATWIEKENHRKAKIWS